MTLGIYSVKTANNWWLRSANSSTNFRNVNNNGNFNNNNANNSNGVVLGFSSARQSSFDEISAHYQREGEYVPRASVNITHDKSGRTLLAWQSLMVMFCFMPGDFMLLYVTIRQQCVGISSWSCNDK